MSGKESFIEKITPSKKTLQNLRKPLLFSAIGGLMTMAWHYNQHYSPLQDKVKLLKENLKKHGFTLAEADSAHSRILKDRAILLTDPLHSKRDGYKGKVTERNGIKISEFPTAEKYQAYMSQVRGNYEQASNTRKKMASKISLEVYEKKLPGMTVGDVAYGTTEEHLASERNDMAFSGLIGAIIGMGSVFVGRALTRREKEKSDAALGRHPSGPA